MNKISCRDIAAHTYTHRFRAGGFAGALTLATSSDAEASFAASCEVAPVGSAEEPAAPRGALDCGPVGLVSPNL